MDDVSVFPLVPLQNTVLFPGGTLQMVATAVEASDVLCSARSAGGTVAVALQDGESVHEVGVTAAVQGGAEGGVALRGLARCRILALVDADVPLVETAPFPEQPTPRRTGEATARLLRQRFQRICAARGLHVTAALAGASLSDLTWRVTAALDLTAEQQQGFLNVPGPAVRAQLLLAVVRNLEKRERFLRPWAALRSTDPWN